MKFDVITTFNFYPSAEGCSSAHAKLGFNEIYSSIVRENVREREREGYKQKGGK